MFKIIVEFKGVKKLYFSSPRKEEVHRKYHEVQKAFKGMNAKVVVRDEDGKEFKFNKKK